MLTFEKEYELYLADGVVRCDDVIKSYLPTPDFSALQFLKPLFVGDTLVELKFTYGYYPSDDEPSDYNLDVHVDADGWTKAGKTEEDLVPAILGSDTSWIESKKEELENETYFNKAVDTLNRGIELKHFIMATHKGISLERSLKTKKLFMAAEELNKGMRVASTRRPVKFANRSWFRFNIDDKSSLFDAIYSIFSPDMQIDFQEEAYQNATISPIARYLEQ